MSIKVRSSRRRASMTSSSFSEVASTVEEGDEQTYTDILAIQRRELALVETSRDVDRAENLRLKQKIKNMERQKEETESLLRDLESLKSRPQITSEQHAELMEKVNQMNILRESNSFLRDEKIRAEDERDQANRKIKDLELKMEPLMRRENEQTKRDNEHKQKLDETNKAKLAAEEEVRYTLMYFNSKRSKISLIDSSKRLILYNFYRVDCRKLLNVFDWF